jgi:hypothetical protein
MTEAASDQSGISLILHSNPRFSIIQVCKPRVHLRCLQSKRIIKSALAVHVSIDKWSRYPYMTDAIFFVTCARAQLAIEMPQISTVWSEVGKGILPVPVKR